MTMTRAVLSVVAAIAAVAIDARPTDAEIYRPWCVQYLGGFSGGTTCAFSSFEQCMETARGNGAFCYQNPWYLVYGEYGERGQAQGADRRRPRQR
jgi:hypothetical protein